MCGFADEDREGDAENGKRFPREDRILMGDKAFKLLFLS